MVQNRNRYGLTRRRKQKVKQLNKRIIDWENTRNSTNTLEREDAAVDIMNDRTCNTSSLLHSMTLWLL
jgi:hypothetical protein